VLLLGAERVLVSLLPKKPPLERGEDERWLVLRRGWTRGTQGELARKSACNAQRGVATIEVAVALEVCLATTRRIIIQPGRCSNVETYVVCQTTQEMASALRLDQMFGVAGKTVLITGGGWLMARTHGA
jgi:hypothetical protein